MTDIDPQADIELHCADGQVTAGVPLAGAVTGEWLRCYQQLALAASVPVRAQARWAKLAMTVQSVGSLTILGLVIARAVNILK